MVQIVNAFVSLGRASAPSPGDKTGPEKHRPDRRMKQAEVKARAFAMPLTGPADLTLGLGRVTYDYLHPFPAKREPALPSATAGVA
jgi:hypothetical protein